MSEQPPSVSSPELGESSERELVDAAHAQAGPSPGWVEPPSDDPLASIRPALPASPAGSTPLTTTLVLETASSAGLATGAQRSIAQGEVTEGGSSASQRTADIEGLRRSDAPVAGRDLGSARDSGPFLIPVIEAGEEALDGAYALLELLGEGGMGEVWGARQRSLGRRIAFKRLRYGREHSPSIVRQFESEARLTAVLDHPNIVTVHELGRDQSGRLFYTMQLIEGTPWDQVLASNQRRTKAGELVELELRDHLEVLLEVANAVAFAHSRGVIHRDIKPGNVMIGDYGEVQVVDWGLALALDHLEGLRDAPTWTLENMPKAALVCGTPAYMSPETASAERERIGPATDVYLLGAVLYHVLYGRPPHKGKNVDQVIAKAKGNTWGFPEELPPRLRPWHVLLRPVLLRALATDPSLRYADAGEFAEALRKAMRNYDSAKVATRAQEKLASLESSASGASISGSYQGLTNVIVRLEQALESWPRNLSARRGLAQAQLVLAEAALDNGDLALAQFALDNFAALPPTPEPEEDLLLARLTLHPPDGTLVGVPMPPADSEVVVGTSKPWLGSGGARASLVASTVLGEGEASSSGASKSGSSSSGSGSNSGSGSPALSRSKISGAASTVGTADIVRRRLSEVSHGTSAHLDRDALISALMAGNASVSIQQLDREGLLADDGELAQRAEGLQQALREREARSERRRRTFQALRRLAAVLGVGLLVLGGIAAVTMTTSRGRIEDDRAALSQALFAETKTTVQAELDALFIPVEGITQTLHHWAQRGFFDALEPETLADTLVALVDAYPGIRACRGADSTGRAFELVRDPEAEAGWRLRLSAPGVPARACSLRAGGGLGVCVEDGADKDAPHIQDWYTGAMAQRAEAGPSAPGSDAAVYWTEPHVGEGEAADGQILVSTAARSGTGLEHVLALDFDLSHISTYTKALPMGVQHGQVFVMFEGDRLIGFPRELSEVDGQARRELLLRPMDEIDPALAPVSHRAYAEWIEHGRSQLPFRVMIEGIAYWAGFRVEAAGARPGLTIAVIVPEAHFQ